MLFRRRRLLAAIAAALPLFAAPLKEEDLDEAIRRIVSVYAAVESQSADPIAPERAFYEGAIPGMLRSLDPHSVFFDPAQFQQLRELEKSTRKGFGTVVSLLPGRVTILQTMPGTPSERSGLSPGDEILAINGIPLYQLDVDQLVQLLTQARQQPARLDVRRHGNARLLQFTMTPEDVQAPSVERAFHVRPEIGYLRVGSFDANTGRDIREAVEKLGGASLRALILDLRNNPGGLMPAALETAALFLPAGHKLVSVRGRSVKDQDITVPAGLQAYDFRVAVLINEKSASGSEIVAGAIQDHKRGIIVGERSFGKGLVQSVFPLSSGTGLALTTAFYYTPSGRSIQRRVTGQLSAAVEREHPDQQGGIQPDRVITPEPSTRLRAVLELSGSLSSFATDYIQRNRTIPPDFTVTPAILDEYRATLTQRNIHPSISEWSREL
ncbi:MAG TPA: S41 family peptidase, partial [Bryobacteraceae bacterium]|nr:S41 family peptidase [Bryobacteraceae bacterium]